eukprot:CAMPEP_0204197046 /NCGR_PEP_ID=MMETSP0361-20130328/64280_1 /ASSEMBLY_ACC=CAM_ASM_000343 /TAXON_ID=268821 /ORGANISM="Scrippsiella Hangoei, Strain SHTV-5" /LENGTH=78 /DNA_ID=CAMNT_0051158909 /DNA_START=82 /DNA_END=314 /DNA_ORIENTATION=+
MTESRWANAAGTHAFKKETYVAKPPRPITSMAKASKVVASVEPELRGLTLQVPLSVSAVVVSGDEDVERVTNQENDLR